MRPTGPAPDRHVPPSVAVDGDRRRALVQVLADAVELLSGLLLHDPGPDPQRARALLAARAVPREAAVAHQLGYAPPGWTALTGRLRAAGHSDQDLLDSGLAVRTRHGRLVDRFRDRLMFPLHDRDGTVISLLGRTLPPAAPMSDSAGVSDRTGMSAAAPAKYLNTPDGPLCHKSQVLYGLGDPPVQAALAARARPVLVEGPLDALAVTWASRTASASASSYVGVAGCGTALSPAQAALLAAHSGPDRDRLVVAYDGDPAGQAGAARALHVLLEAGLWPAACRLPAGTDPAALLQTGGPQALLQTLAQAVPLADVAVDSQLDRWDTRWAEGTVMAARDAARLIAQLPADHIGRQVQRVADRLRLPLEQVTSLVTTAVTSPHGLTPSPQRSATRAPATARLTPARSAGTASPAAPSGAPPAAGRGPGSASPPPGARRR